MSLDVTLQKLWYGPARRAWWLMPLSALFGAVSALRRGFYRIGLLRSYRLDIPVIVVGNLTVGGTGKTPLVIWLTQALQTQGKRVAIITRGYGGQAKQWPQLVQPDSDPEQFGDEAVLLAQQTSALVFAGPDRVAAGQAAINAGAELIVSDDGLQHYRLQRDVELAVIDASRGVGNGWLLPAGPLREGTRRLRRVNAVLLNQRDVADVEVASLAGLTNLAVPVLSYRVVLRGLRAVQDGKLRDLSSLRGQSVHIVTGIGNPQAFVQALRGQGINADARVFPDHARFTPADLEFGDQLPVLMTAKDAVKCASFAGRQHWCVDAQVELSSSHAAQLLAVIDQGLARAKC